MTSAFLRVLCLDIEGGHGGSSRSLFESVRYLDRDQVQAEVWCRREGPAQAHYAALDVPCRVVSGLPKVSSLPRLSRNLLVYAGFTRDFLRAGAFRRSLAREVNARFDRVHFNHEGLFLLARWLRPRTEVPLTMHIRTKVPDTPFARWQTRTISRGLDHLVFITENEEEHHRALGGTAPGTVIYNAITLPDGRVSPHPAVPDDRRFKIASLSNYSWLRGTDRLVDVAETLAALGRRDFLFVAAGEMSLSRSLPGALGKIGRRGGSLKEYVDSRGVGDMFLFLGHVSEPERVLSGCDALAKPTREDNPWGRDILEAFASGKPVLSVGRWDRFVEAGKTGILQRRFNAHALARELVELADDRERCAVMGATGRERVRRLCNGPDRAAELFAVWENVRRR
ncbi:MAG: glycosyltransferase family 4 protein [Kiloniellales bacterium]